MINRRRMLITGGLGFQGLALTTHFDLNGWAVTVLNTPSEDAIGRAVYLPPRTRVVWGSITDYEVVSKTIREVDVVLHLAALTNVDESLEEPRAAIEVNMTGTYNVLKALRAAKRPIKAVIASSCEVYGPTVTAQNGEVGHRLQDESHPLNPLSPYAASKAAADRLAYAFAKAYGMDLTIVRPCNVFGEWQKRGRHGAVIPIFVDRGMRGEPLHVHGDGSQWREYMHVSDLVMAYVTMLNSNLPPGSVVNFGTGQLVTVQRIADVIGKRFGVPVINGPARPGEVAGFLLDSSKAHSLGWAPVGEFDYDLDVFISWAKTHWTHA